MYPFRNSRAFPSCHINSLPVELLSEIFNICALSANPVTERSDYSPPVINSESILVPIVLSSVSRRWRSIALSQANLWSNICITPELLDWESDNGVRSSQLNASQVKTYISRSRNSPLNILIDGRDPDWDFSEPDVGIDCCVADLDPLFSDDHMSAALSILLPNIARWKHLTILTDTWRPMYIALKLMNPILALSGAPFLQSLSLMRCNDYVSYSRRFQPRQFKDAGFLTPTTTTSACKSRADLLPNLKHLALHGVHVDWDSLGNILEGSQSGLSYLELASHSKDVRPSMNQFHSLLKSTPHLQSLSVVGSGPEGPGSEDDSAHNYEPIHLPYLRDLTLGYRTETGGRSLLHFLDAPNVKSLVLDDTTYPADPSDVNAGPMLSYLAMKRCDGSEHDFQEAASQSTTTVAEYEKKRKRSICLYPDHSEAEQLCGIFPLLNHVTLRNVKSTFQPLTTFFNSLRHATHLEFSGMSMLSIHALVPYSPTPSDGIPCPRLHSLTIKDSDLNVEDLDFIINRLSSCRQARGAPDLQDLNFHVKPSRASDIGLITAAAASSPASIVHIISDKDVDSESGEDNFMIADEEDAAFRPGGVFDDPVFDEYYFGNAVVSL